MREDIFETFIERTTDAASIDDLEAAFAQTRDKLGLSHLLYHWVNAEGDLFGAGTYTDAWRDRYIAENYARVDPVVMAAFQRFHPIDWRTLDWTGRGTRAFAEDAHSNGIGAQGITIPIRGPNGQFAHFTGTRDCGADEWAGFLDGSTRQLILLGHFVNQRALELRDGGAGDEAPGVTLSGRETDALTFLALGHSRARIAETLSISEHTLRVYIESARAKLQAHNTTAAVAKALKLGLLVL